MLDPVDFFKHFFDGWLFFLDIALQAKIGMLDNLMEIEVAYNLIATNSEEDKGKDPIDAHYQKLKTDIEVLDKSSEEYRIIESYVHNTHAATHTLYRLEIDQVIIGPVSKKNRQMPTTALSRIFE